MNIKEKAGWLVKFYSQVAEGGVVEHHDGSRWVEVLHSPSAGSMFKNWRIKPTLKPVDLSVLIESGIDCEFGEAVDMRIGKLKNIVQGKYYTSHFSELDSINDYDTKCQPRMNHIHAWQGGKCPLPEGLAVRLYLRGGVGYMITTDYKESENWNHNHMGEGGYDIIAFEILPELVDFFRWPWELAT